MVEPQGRRPDHRGPEHVDPDQHRGKVGEELGVADEALDDHDGQEDPPGVLDAGRGVRPPEHPQQDQHHHTAAMTTSAWIRVMSSSPSGIRLASLSPGVGTGAGGGRPGGQHRAR